MTKPAGKNTNTRRETTNDVINDVNEVIFTAITSPDYNSIIQYHLACVQFIPFVFQGSLHKKQTEKVWPFA